MEVEGKAGVEKKEKEKKTGGRERTYEGLSQHVAVPPHGPDLGAATATGPG